MTEKDRLVDHAIDTRKDIKNPENDSPPGPSSEATSRPFRKYAGRQAAGSEAGSTPPTPEREHGGVHNYIIQLLRSSRR